MVQQHGASAADSMRAAVRARHPRLFAALVADARIASAMRAEPWEYRGPIDGIRRILQLMWTSDAFLGQALYRAKARFQGLGVPLLPAVLHRLAMMTAQVCIGDPVVMQPGVYIAHGQVVIDGLTEIQRNVVIFPWVTVGLRAGNFRGPRIRRGAQIGTGAKIIGPITVGEGAHIGANAVVVDDVPARSTVVGVPARPRAGT